MTGDKLRSRPFYLRLDGANRFCLLHGRERPFRGSVLYVHPFAEEMNKSRRMAGAQARALAAAGFAVLQMDLFGCGDSDGDFGDADWERWLADVRLAYEWLGSESGCEPVLWGLRAGCLLATSIASQMSRRTGAELVLWQPVVSGRQHLQQWLRLGVAGRLLDASAADRSGTKALHARLAAGEAVEIAGYRLSPKLAAGLENTELVPPGMPSRVAWFEIASGSGEALSPASASRIAAWRRTGHDAVGCPVTGLSFWQTQEIAEIPELVRATTAAIGAWRA